MSPRRSRLVAGLILIPFALGLLAAPVGAQEPTASAGGPQPGPASISREQFRQELFGRFPMEEPARRGGSIIVGSAADISTVNGLLAADAQTLQVTGAIFETLVGGSPIDGQIVPGLADAWEVSPDGLTYTFRLNQAAKWRDGVDATAEDVKFSFDAVLDPNTGSLYTTAVNDAVASYRVVDPDTFEITARDRLVSFLYDAPGTVFVMPKHIWEAVGFESWSVDPGSTGDDPSRVVGTGPFKFKEWLQGDKVTLVRNDAHYDAVPNIDEFTTRVLPDENAAVQALKAEEIDVLEIVPPAQTEDVQNEEELDVHIYDLLDFTFYAYNLDPERTTLFQDQRVRRALFQSIDRDLITQNIFLGFGEVAVGTQPKLSPAYAPERMTTQYPFDPEGARALLAEAGWEANDDDVLEKDGEAFEFDLLLAEGSGTVDQMATYMQEAWRDIGIRMNVEKVPGGTLLEAINARDFDALLVSFSISPEGSQGLLFTCDAYTTGFNFMRYCNPRYDELEQLQKREFDRARRIDLMVEQTNLLWNDLPIGMLRFGVGRTGHTTRLHNFYPNGFGFLWSLPYVWIEE